MREGIILRITLERFVTFDYVTVRPGPSLNLVVGANGTGKSSIVAAIILGLGGKPKAIGRGSTINTFIKMGCNDGCIEIELYNPNGSNHIVRRFITLDNRSEWNLNGTLCSLKEVENLVTKLNIQVDNLCLFLPQDRVQDFAKMNRQSLFENTMKCIGMQGLLTDHQMLKEIGRNECGMEQELEENQRRIDVEMQRNSRIERDVQSIKERQNLLKQITSLGQKLAWMEYFVQRTKYTEVTSDKAKSEAAVKSQEEKLAPLAQEMKELRKMLNQLDVESRRTVPETQKLFMTIQDRIEEGKMTETEIVDLQDNHRLRVTQEQNRVKEVEVIRNEANKLRNDLASLEGPCVDDVAAKLVKLSQRIDAMGDEVANAARKRDLVQNELTNVGHELRNQEAAFKRLDDVKNLRLQRLQSYKKDIYDAVLWLRQNRHLFQGAVYEPMFLELNVTEPQYCKFIEAIVPLRDLQAFTCENKDDLGLFLDHLRVKRRLKLNVLYSGPDEPPLSSYKPRRPLQQLKQFGFHSYAIDLVQGPEAIIKYLCKMTRFYDIPVGNDFTFQNSNKVPTDIWQFYSEKHVFNVSTSRYSREVSSRMMELPEARFMIAGPQVYQVDRQRARVEQTKQKQVEAQARLQEMLGVHNEHKKSMDRLLEERRHIKKSVDARKTIETRLKIKEQHIRAMMQDQMDVEAETAKCEEDIKVVLTQAVAGHRKDLQLFHRYEESQVKQQLLNRRLHVVTKQLASKDGAFNNLESQLADAKKILTLLERKVEECRATSIQMLGIAKQKTEGLGPKHPRFKEFQAVFDTLPATIEALNEDMADKMARAECLGAGDGSLIVEYEKRQEKIAELQEKMEAGVASKDSLKVQREQLKATWLPSVGEFVGRINDKFAECFNLLKCCGEVLLYQGEDEDDFEHYGLSIRVKFREADELQELSRYMQSGGERAVSTAIYLISLQGLTSVPFCCVDEINQGMDPFNERLVIDLLVATTEQVGSPQYLVLTPKLLPSMAYSDTMKVHIVFNGMNCKAIDLRRMLDARAAANAARAAAIAASATSS